MKPYFENDDNWNELQVEMATWLGTPYRHLAMTKGRGADCTLFIGGAWRNCGILDEVTHDYYPKDWHVHTQDEMVLESISRHYKEHFKGGLEVIRFDPMDASELIRGDLLTFNYPARGILVSHHAALWVGNILETRQRNIMINAVEQRGIIHMQFGSYWRNRLTNIFRIMEV